MSTDPDLVKGPFPCLVWSPVVPWLGLGALWCHGWDWEQEQTCLFACGGLEHISGVLLCARVTLHPTQATPHSPSQLLLTSYLILLMRLLTHETFDSRHS